MAHLARRCHFGAVPAPAGASTPCEPCFFPELVIRPGEMLYISKRDAASFFDVLRAPAEAVVLLSAAQAGELAAAMGISLAGLHKHLLEAGESVSSRTLLHPASLTWPMGFAWSSAVARDVTLGILRSSGFPDSGVLCDAEEVPSDDEDSAVVATDDAIFFHRDPTVARARLLAFDEAMARADVPRAAEKDIDLASEFAGLGCELLSAPPAASPDSGKLQNVILATLGLDVCRQASPKAVHSILGVDQWFCLVSHPLFAWFRDTYALASREPGDVPVAVPQVVIDELVLFCALAPLLSADLGREWLPMVAATDAAPEFGFRTSVCSLPASKVAEFGRKAERRGDYVRLDRSGGPDDEPERPRLGRPHRLGLSKEDFREVLSLKAAKPEHAGVMELKGVLLSLRWLLRSAGRHG